jgi:hypothetical protein
VLDRQGSRFALEVLFLAALATGLALAKLDALEIIAAMAVGWVVVALLEWAAWRGEPHYYVPTTSLPPPQPLEQVYAGYPDPQREEAPTWIASADLRERLMGEWPITAQQDADAADDDDVQPVQLPPAPIPLPTPAPAPVQPPVAAAAPAPAAVPAPVLPLAPAREYGTASHQLEPFAAQPARRRFGKRIVVEAFVIEVPARVVPAVLPRRPAQE